MLNEKFIGVIKSCKADTKTAKLEDGTKVREGIYKVKLESSDVDYESMAKFNPNVSGTILNIQPAPFKMINFGDQSTLGLRVDFYGEEPEQEENRLNTSESDARYNNVFIKNLSVVIAENIPTYIFDLEIPQIASGKFLFRAIKSKISFVFSEMKND